MLLVLLAVAPLFAVLSLVLVMGKREERLVDHRVRSAVHSTPSLLDDVLEDIEEVDVNFRVDCCFYNPK